MRTKAEIVQELLEKKAINAEDAVVLLMNVEKEYVYVPHMQPAQPLNPYYGQPAYKPFEVYCGGKTTASIRYTDTLTIN